ncbi:unnamed protein product [Periconia digitata]|uniref:Uncharacterized protein n=1 Tax=Periconia digitata TaxID=1303443 RepID=A0A9W4UC39_9PLEO|nr:unnamed protein product [Periconia digitata]
MATLDAKLASQDSSPLPGHHQMIVSKHDEQFSVTFPDGTILGDANAQLERALSGIYEQQYQVELEAFAPIRPIRDTISRANKGKEAVVRIHINVYGPRTMAPGVGQELSTNKVYLQKPDHVRFGLAYENPHILRIHNFQPPAYEQPIEVREEGQAQTEIQKAEDFKHTIATIYSSLEREDSLSGSEGDGRLKTELLPHQKKALTFMIQRESGPIPEKFRLWRLSEAEGRPCFRHVITNYTSQLNHDETGGGILADEMGMGKTLSILALILRTLAEALDWTKATPDLTFETNRGHTVRRRSKATLVIASSDLMINEWFQEMDKHFDPRVCDVFTKVKYHGSNRKVNFDKTCDADIIITTYHTLQSDCAKKDSPLHDIEWYRLVLDEAHIVRRQSSELYRTVSGIKARSRWCLTGTPIQNRLEDIGSLFAFMRIVPFNTLSVFRKYIASPFEEGDTRRDQAIRSFTKLLDSMCLRRSKDLLKLPNAQQRLHKIGFSPAERMQYEQTKSMMLRAAKNQVGGLDQRSTLGLFQVQLQLRILCNHGTYQQPFSWNRRKLHLMDAREDIEASMGGDGEVTCSACKQTMPILEPGTSYRRYTDDCRHVLCSECLEESMPGAQEDELSNCPLCDTLWKYSSSNPQSHHASRDDMYFRPEGKSSKMEALMRDVQMDVNTTKSIIFSCWTHTLDLISTYLNRAQITFRRIDGECPTAKRESILDEFACQPHLRVLIMTTGTGAVGLNLATANRVFIVEPQWNPSVENQAIARALRLGQENVVQINRYVVDGTVEQDMRSQQYKKQKMADIAWE